MAPDVTERLLVSFRRFMRFPRGVGLGPAAVALAGAASSLFLFSLAPAVHAECGTASSGPCPTPTPVNAFLSIDPTTGDPNTVINVSGGQFLPNESMSLYWDQQDHVAGSAKADANGNVNTVRVKPFAGDSPGVHHLCASVPPNPCANFSLQALPPTPSPSPTPTESPSPTPTPIATDTTPIAPPPARNINGFDVITKPPFVFLPIAGLAAIALAFGFWLFSYLRRPRQPAALPTAAIVHRAMRPDYSSDFGASPPPSAPAEPSAWDPSVAHPPTSSPPQPSPPPAEESQVSNVEWGEPVEWGTGSGDWGFPEPPAEGDDPQEPPQSGR